MRTTYTMRAGKIRYQGYQCDIDTVRFVANVPYDTKANRRPFRLECCDSLEVNFLAGHQPRDQAFEFVTAWMNLISAGDYAANMLRDKFLYVETEVPCWAAQGSPDAYGRSVGFLFPASESFTEGQVIAAAALDIAASWNLAGAEAGWFYPAFYSDTVQEIRDQMRPAFEAARDEPTGVWTLDSTTSFEFEPVTVIQETAVIWPPAFRFLMQFYASRENYTEFAAWCTQNRKPIRVDGFDRYFGELFETDDTETGILTDLLDVLFVV
jgi:hypothetical protein